MDLTIARREALELFHAVNGLAKFSTQAGFYIASNVTTLKQIPKEHDNYVKTLEQNYATKTGEGETQTIVYDKETNAPKLEGQGLRDFEKDYEKYLDEKIEVKGLKTFSKNDLKVRISEKGRSELTMPDLPGALLGPCLEHGLITDAD